MERGRAVQFYIDGVLMYDELVGISKNARYLY